jgi:4-amino-4-deoxy-L-arabinose transferase-like glycosyltransferase
MRAPAYAIAALALGALLVRLPYLGVPLDTDEGGYAYAALNWSRGADLYREVWADRPQALFLAFRGLVGLAPEPWAVRLGAGLAAAGITALLGMIAWLLRGPAAGVLAAGVYALVSVGPRIQGFAFNGELAASLPSTAAVAAGVLATRSAGRRRLALLAAAGALGAIGTLMKQSGWDGLVVAAAVALVVRDERTRRSRAVLAVAAGAAVPLLASALHGLATGWDDYWFAVAGYRLNAPSGAGGGLAHRWDRLSGTLPKAALDLWPLLLVIAGAALARGRATARWSLPLVWLAAALAGFALGAQYYPHYYVQLVAPLVLLASLAAASFRRPAARLAIAALLLLPAGGQLAYLAALHERDLDAWVMDDRRLLANREIAPYLRERTAPGEPIYAFVTSADLYFLTDRRSPYPYLWMYNVLEIPGALERLRGTLAGPSRPSWVVLYQRPDEIDPSGRMGEVVARGYREETRIGGFPVLRRSEPPA